MDSLEKRNILITIFLLLIAFLIPYIVGTYFHFTSVPYFSSVWLMFISEIVFFTIAIKTKIGIQKTLLFQLSKAYLLIVIPLGESIGYFSRLWNYLLSEPSYITMFGYAYLEALTFASVMINIALLYSYFFKINQIRLAYSVLLFNIVFGYCVDIFINQFNSYISTIFVWGIMEFGYFGLIYVIQKEFYK